MADGLALMESKLDELLALQKKTQHELETADAAHKKEIADLKAKIDGAVTDVGERVLKAKRLSLPGVEVAKDDKQKNAFSFARMVKMLIQKEYTEDPDYGYEVEVGREMKKAWSSLENVVKAELSAGTGETGGFLIPTEVQSTLVPFLREVSIARQLGTTVFSNLTGNIIWNRMATDFSTAHINTEQSETIPTSAAKFERLEMRPHVLAAMVPMTFEMMTQTAISLEDFVRQQLAARIAIDQDQAIFLGIGASSIPRGLKNHPQIQSFDWQATITGFGTTPDYGASSQNITPRLLAIWQKVRKKSAAFGRLGWAMSPDGLVLVCQTLDKFAHPIFADPGSLLASSFVHPSYKVAHSEMLDDAANQNETMIFGNYADLVLGEWGAMAFRFSDTSGTDFDTVKGRLRAVLAWDAAVWHGDSFVNVTGLR